MQAGTLGILRRSCLAASLLSASLLAVIMFPTSVGAEVIVRAEASAVQLVAKEAPLGDVLNALAANLPILYEAKINLEGTLNGTFSGQPDQVLDRVLQGYSYIIISRGPAINLIILGKSGTAAAGTRPAMSTPAAPNANPAPSTSPVAPNTSPAAPNTNPVPNTRPWVPNMNSAQWETSTPSRP